MIGLPAFVANKVLLPAFYSRKDTKSPVKIALRAMAVNVILNFVFVGLLYYLGVVSLHVGLAMAGVGSAWLQCLWLYRQLKHDGIIVKPLVSVAYCLKISFSLGLMATVIWWLNSVFPEWYALTWIDRLINLFTIIGLAALIYFVSMWTLRVKYEFK